MARKSTKKTTTHRSIKRKIQNGIRKVRMIKKRAVRKTKVAVARRVRKPRLKKEKVNTTSREGILTSARISGEKEHVEVMKFAAVDVAPAPTVRYTLPSRYYDNRITLLPRDPWWLHTYWDISQEKIDEVVGKIPPEERYDLRWVLRVYDLTASRKFDKFFDVSIDVSVNNWYVNVDAPEREWCVEIGLLTRTGKFFPVARSNVVKTPYFGISDVIDEEWALPDEEYFKVLGIYDLGRSSLERKQKFEEVLKHQISSAAFSGGISSLFSMREKKEVRKFFLEVWTELILYGRTEPTATVSVCGKNVKLREDGTFSLRYALPEGDFRFDVVATSYDKKDTITKIPAVKRYTIK